MAILIGIHKMGYTFSPSPDAPSRVDHSQRERRQNEPSPSGRGDRTNPLLTGEATERTLSQRERRQNEPSPSGRGDRTNPSPNGRGDRTNPLLAGEATERTPLPPGEGQG